MFATPLGLLALTALPVVVGLHLYRRRSKPQVVSALFLWPVEAQLPAAGRRRERLHQDLSFWCEILAALLLAVALAGPRGCTGGEAQHLVVVLDSSASMGAVVPQGESAMERARRAIGDRIADLPSGSRVTLLASGPAPRILAGPAAFPAEARAVLDEHVATLRSHPLGPTLDLALELAGEGEVLLVGDGMDEMPEGVSLLAVGEAVDNLALAQVARRREGTSQRIEFVVQSFASANRTVAWSVMDDAGRELQRDELELAPGERRALRLKVDSNEPLWVRLQPGEGDALAIDNEAFLPAPPHRTVRLFSELSPELGQGLGIARGTNPVGGWLELVPAAMGATTAESAHLVLAETEAGEGSAWRLVLGAGDGEPRPWVGPFLVDRAHPALTGISLGGVVWCSGSVAPEGAPLIAAGSEPLFTETVFPDGRRLWRADLDPRRSSLHRSPDWPILLANLVELRRRELPGPRTTQLALGEPLLLRANSPASYTLRGPDLERSFDSSGDVVLGDLLRPGRYDLERTGDEAETWTFGVNFIDGRESDLRQRSRATVESERSLAHIQAGIEPWKILLLAFALALYLLDWAFLGGLLRRGKREGARP